MCVSEFAMGARSVEDKLQENGALAALHRLFTERLADCGWTEVS